MTKFVPLWSESPSENFKLPAPFGKQGNMGAGRAMSTPSLPAEHAASAHIAASSSLAILNTGRIQSCTCSFLDICKQRTKQARVGLSHAADLYWPLFFSGYVVAGLGINVMSRPNGTVDFRLRRRSWTKVLVVNSQNSRRRDQDIAGASATLTLLFHLVGECGGCPTCMQRSRWTQRHTWERTTANKNVCQDVVSCHLVSFRVVCQLLGFD